MHRVVPELIIENYRGGRYNGEFSAVGLFLDLSGFSTMTDTLMQHGQHGAEVLAGLMHGVFDPLVESIFNYGGKIVSFAGDGIMALYPIESDAKSMALSALASAWEIQQRLGENPGRQTVYGKFTFSVKIGLAVGGVTWGILRSDDHKDATYYFRGAAVEESANAEHHASAGEIVITGEMNELLRDAIRTRSLGSFRRFGRFRVEIPSATPTVFPPVDLDTARAFVPEEIVTQDLRGEFRQIVNLFMRFPDLPSEKLHEFFNVVFELRNKYGGLLNRLDFGDKGCNMLMLWGAPMAYENDIGRALNFILDLKARVGFPITTGVTYYIAHAGYLGSMMCEDYTCYGWGVNLASRFMMSASPDQIWVDDRIARRVSSRFDIEYVGAQRFKGFSAEQVVNLLKGHKQEAKLIYQGELIGREKELADLETFVESLWRGEFAGLLLVLGDAGIGKGHLAHGFRTSALFEKNKTLWALCQSDQILRQSFNPFRSWLLRYFSFSSANTLAERKQIFDLKLRELIASTSEPDLARELDRLHSVLGALVDLFWTGSLYEQLDAEGRYNSTLLALIALIKAECMRQPLILFIEDAQYIDDDTLNFLPRLKRSLLKGKESYPVVIIATSRIQGSHRVMDGGLVDKQIDLKGLSTEAVARLVEILLGGVPAVELVKRVMERSEGNPYFVEQIVRYLQEENLIEMSQVGWTQVKRMRDFFLPGDIRAALVARLDQLTHEVKDVVQTASVLGREFTISALAEMVSGAEKIEQIVAEAEQSEIWAPHGGNRFVFTHGLLRDAAYTMQMRARRQELHTLAVGALEKIYAGDVKFHYAELAHHAERAALIQKTQQYCSLAGRSSADAYQNSQAIEFFTRALAFTPFDDLKSQYDLLLERTGLYDRVGDRASQARDLDSLEKLARQLGDRKCMARVESMYSYYCYALGEYPAVIEHSIQAMDLIKDTRAIEIGIDTFRVWSAALLRLGKLDEAMQRAKEELQFARDAGKRLEEGRALSGMGLIELERMEPVLANEYLMDAVRIAREIRNTDLEAKALNNLAILAGTIQGDFLLARDYYEQAYAIMRERGNRYGECLGLGNLGYTAGMVGDFDAAREFLEEALSISREIGSLYQEAYTLINLGAVTGMKNEAQASFEYSQSALELCRKTGDRSGEAWSCLYLGYALMALNKLDQAESTFRQSVTIRENLGQASLLTEPLAGSIQVALLQNNHDRAMQEVEKILSHLENGGALEGTEEPLRVYYACYLALVKNQDPRSNSLLREAIGLLEAQVSKLRDEESRRLYIENIPWRLAIQQTWHEQFN